MSNISMHRISIASVCLLYALTGCVDLSSTTSPKKGDRIGAQVDEGLRIAQQYETPVATAIRRVQAQDPHLSSVNSVALPLRLPTSGKFVESVTVSSGLIVVRYGRSANRAIAGKELALTPGTTASGDVVWICGRAKAPPGLMIGSPERWQHTTVENQYLPESCRP